MSSVDGEREDARDAAKFFAHLTKGIKNIHLYRHAEERFSGLISPAHQALTRFLHKHKSLPLKLGPHILEYQGTPVYHEKDRESIAYKFYRDGMRYIIFREGISRDELLRFVLLSLDKYSEQELLREDMVTRFWKEEFQYIEQVVVEDFSFEDVTEDDVCVDVDRIVDHLREQLSSSSQDIARFARFSIQDLTLELKDIEQIRGGIIAGCPATQEDRQNIQDELLKEDQQSMLPKLMVIIFQLIELEVKGSDCPMLMEALVQILDLCLVSDDIAGTVNIYKMFDKLNKKPLEETRASMVSQMYADFLVRMVEPQRLQQLGQYLQLARELDTRSVDEYLMICGESELELLLDILIHSEPRAEKKCLIDALVRIGKDRIDVFKERLSDPSSVVVKDMLDIIFAIDPPEKITLVASCMEHPSVMVRLEALQAMTKDPSRASLQYIQKALDDEHIQLRMGALRALLKRSPKATSQQLILLMKGTGFFQREDRERNAIAESLGKTKTPEALHYFSEILAQRKKLFNRRKQYQLKMLAIAGLQAMCTPEAFHAVNGHIQNRSHSMELTKACHDAAHCIKDRLEKEYSHG